MCFFEYKDSYVYSLNNRQKFAQEVAAYQQLGVPAEFCSTLPLPFPVAGAVKLTEQAQFHPLQFARGISKGLNIYEHTRVQELIGTKAVTPDGTIQANKILVTTHFPFLNKHGCYFLKLYQHRSYVLALKNTPQLAVNAGEAVINLLRPTAKRCPHLGCALKWNPQEHTWDCPCHGSRFTEDGRLIDNPATGDLK